MGSRDYEYICGLSRQFILATGTVHADPNSKLFQSEFNGWLKMRQAIGSRYASFISSMEAHPMMGDAHSIEVGKGGDDSIAVDLGVDILTSHIDTFNNKGIVKLTDVKEGTFKLVDGKFVVVVGKGFRSYKVPFDFENTRRIITHNPYSLEEIEKWEDVHNSGIGNVTFGVYGCLSDKDAQMKIRQVEIFREKLDSSYLEDYVVSNGNYFYAISSSRKTLYKSLSR